MCKAGGAMFESLDSETDEQKAKKSVTVGEALGVYALILLLAFGSLVAFIALGDQPYGVQVATLISYLGAVFIWTFFKTRGINTSYSLSDSYVQEQVPRLLLIHALYLAAVFLLQTWALSVRSSLSDWWLTSSGRKGMPPFIFGQMLIGMAIGISEVVFLRTILARAKARSVKPLVLS